MARKWNRFSSAISKVGEGSTFTLRMPRPEPQEDDQVVDEVPLDDSSVSIS